MQLCHAENGLVQRIGNTISGRIRVGCLGVTDEFSNRKMDSVPSILRLHKTNTLLAGVHPFPKVIQKYVR